MKVFTRTALVLAVFFPLGYAFIDSDEMGDAVEPDELDDAFDTMLSKRDLGEDIMCAPKG